MKTTYIFHSSFLVETDHCYYLFDYFKGNLPKMNPSKHIIVFSSHFHQDHYSSEIFTLLKKAGMESISAVLSKDISPSKHPSDLPVTVVTHGMKYELGYDTTLETLLSTDEGVAFLITCPEGTIYHAGDLNDWVWAEESEEYNKQMTGTFRHEIDKISGRSIDLAFLVLDPRQENDYDRGILYFLKKTNTKRVFPMHYWEKPETIEKFTSSYPEYKSLIEYTEDYISL